MAITETDIKALAIQSVDETIQSALDKGVDLAGVEIVISFEKTTQGVRRATSKLIRNVFAISIDQARCFDSIEDESRPQPKPQVASNAEAPKWDGRELFCCERLIKRYRNPGPNQQMVLTAFEEEGWPERIDNPLCSTAVIDAQSRLADTIKSLNRNHKCCLIKFHGDGSGQGVIWKRVDDKSNCEAE